MNKKEIIKDAEIVENTYTKSFDEKSNKHFLAKVLICILLIAVGALGMYLTIELTPGTTIINKTEKEVTVNENGIADAVEKVYDATVIVENYVKSNLYGTGSGFIFEKKDNTYYVMTNYHVVQSATTVKITLTNGETIETTVVGGDKYSDIAVLSFESKEDLTVAEIGSSTDARVGDTVFAVGSPVNSEVYSWTVTRGILSGKDRMVSVSTSSTSFGSTSADYIMKLLQTDAAINSGNSGGPLCNSNGQVIGITNMKLVTTTVESMGFAIPIEDAYAFAQKLINNEDTTRPVLGVSMLELDKAAYYNIDIDSSLTEGVVVYKVESGSAADEGGIKANDVIVEFDGVSIDSVAKLKYELYCHSIGDTVKIKVNRNGSEKELTVKLTK